MPQRTKLIIIISYCRGDSIFAECLLKLFFNIEKRNKHAELRNHLLCHTFIRSRLFSLTEHAVCTQELPHLTISKPASEDAVDYVVDTRPLCAGMPFVLTDAAHPRKVLKSGCNFLVLDEMAQVPACNTLGYGYYWQDTRHLSQWEIFLNDVPLSLLSSDLQRGYSARFLYTNPQLPEIPQQHITVERELVLHELLWEQVTIQNFGKADYDLRFEMKFHSDFADMFEVRGLNRQDRGQRMLPSNSPDRSAIFLAYRGVDNVLLETVIKFFGKSPDEIHDGAAIFNIHLPVRSSVQFAFCIANKMDGKAITEPAPGMGFFPAKQAAESSFQQWRQDEAQVKTDHHVFNLSVERCFNDFYILRQETPKGFGIAAGLPWYSSIFGRDSAIAANQALPFMRSMAKESIEVLAAYQGNKLDSYRAEEPGKIMHELRLGELARCSLIPHSPYYGTVDATQLWILLFCNYFKWTGDFDFARTLWPQLRAAVEYLDRAAEAGNGYIRYSPTPNGLHNQGWKDSDDSIMCANGKLLDAPIAVAEAQAYLYSARLELASVADLLGHGPLASKLRADAESLKKMFRQDFWMPDQQFVCIALDGQNNKADVISSNAGHCLWTGILGLDEANAVADRLMQREMHSGWGIRTLSRNTVAFNPVSYHNGSVWPHDNAIIGEGMRKLGRINDMMKIMDGIAQVSMVDEEHRLPELFCGFDRNDDQRPIEYPVSCSPQAWAAGSLLHMLTACLNFQPDAANQCLKLVEPALPEWLGVITVRGLKVGNAELDMQFEWQHGNTYAKILRKTGKLKVIVENG